MNSPQADQYLLDIWLYIAEDNLYNAVSHLIDTYFTGKKLIQAFE